MSQYNKQASKSALYKIRLHEIARGESVNAYDDTIKPEAYNTIFICQSAVDDELAGLADLSSDSLYPTGKIGNKRVIVIPDVILTDTMLDWSHFIGEKKE